MKIGLDYLRVENFKGIDKFEFKLSGKSAIVTGENATGKTTLADAFFWLISDTNADNKGQFNPLMAGHENGVEKRPPASVEAGFLIDSKTITLKKIFKQKFTKKRGKADKIFSGHKTDFFYNSAPVTQKAYQAKLDDIIKPDLFRVLSDVKQFCGRATADYRRNFLLTMVGMIDEDQFFEEHLELKPLKVSFEGRTHDECKSYFMSKKRELEKKLHELPIRIEESKKLNDEELNLEEIEAAIKKARLESEPDLEELARNKKIHELEMQLSEIRQTRIHNINKMEHEIERLGLSLQSDDANARALSVRINQLEILMADNADERKKLVTKWKAINQEEYTAGHLCFACGQELPEEKFSIQVDRFNQDKATRLKTIDRKGKELFNEFNRISTKKIETEKTLKELTGISTATRDKINNLKLALADFKAKPFGVEVKEKIEKLKSNLPAPEVDDKSLELEKLMVKRAACLYQIKREKQVAGYEEELKQAGKDFEAVEQQLYLLTEYNRLWNEYLESTVNEFFVLTDWKLFENQINNGVKSICEPIYQGISYNSDLNTGAKINVGLDCINAISKHFNIQCPVFIDNAESVTNWIETDLQLIKMVAQPNLKELEVIIDETA